MSNENQKKIKAPALSTFRIDTTTVTLFFLIFLFVDTKKLDLFQWYFVTKIVLTYCEKKLF